MSDTFVACPTECLVKPSTPRFSLPFSIYVRISALFRIFSNVTTPFSSLIMPFKASIKNHRDLRCPSSLSSSICALCFHRNMFDDRQSKTCSARRLRAVSVYAIKTLKDMLLVLRRNTDTRVLHADNHLVPNRPHFQLHAAAAHVVGIALSHRLYSNSSIICLSASTTACCIQLERHVDLARAHLQLLKVLVAICAKSTGSNLRSGIGASICESRMISLISVSNRLALLWIFARLPALRHSAFNQFRITRNARERRFQFMGDICRKFHAHIGAAQNFVLLLDHIHERLKFG